MEGQWIEIFKTGTHTDGHGRTKTYTEADLDRIVRTYDPNMHEAPIVIGHPKDNAPAYGWVGGLKRVGQVLLFKARQVIPEFAEMVRSGLFKKRSISLYPGGSLRHIGFLGALPPAVKGLRDIAVFSEGLEDCFCFDGESESDYGFDFYMEFNRSYHTQELESDFSEPDYSIFNLTSKV